MRIGYVPQEIALFSELKARQNLRFFGSLYGLEGALLEQRTDEALDFVGLFVEILGPVAGLVTFAALFAGGAMLRFRKA